MDDIAAAVIEASHVAHIGNAVQDVGVLDAAHAVGGETAVAGTVGGHDARSQAPERQPVPAVKRKLRDFLGVDDGPGGARFALNQWRTASDFDALGGLP